VSSLLDIFVETSVEICKNINSYRFVTNCCIEAQKMAKRILQIHIKTISGTNIHHLIPVPVTSLTIPMRAI
jgi:hypothetical protein